MSRLAIVNNVRAGRTRARLRQVREMIRASGAVCIDVADLPGICAAVDELLAGDIDVLAVNGGDGTAQAVVSQLLREPGRLPDLAILPGGTTNLTAYDLSGRSRLAPAFNRLAEQARRSPDERAHVRRPLLRVDQAGEPAQFGFFLGAGAILAGMRHFRDQVGARGWRDELAAGLSLLRGLAGVARGEGDWSNHVVRLEIPGADAVAGMQNLVLATTLERLLLGLRPWWGTQAAPVHLTAVSRTARRFLRLAPGILRGRPAPAANPDNGYFSANLERFALLPGDAFALDGQVFATRPEQRIEVSATPPVRFLSLRT